MDYKNCSSIDENGFSIVWQNLLFIIFNKNENVLKRQYNKVADDVNPSVIVDEYFLNFIMTMTISQNKKAEFG